MARIRTTKPEFWTSEQVMECSPIARLLFIGMWNFCDDGGNHPASARTLKAEIFPSDDITSTDIQRMLDELSSNSLIVLYTAQDKDFYHVTGWDKHQKIDRPTFKHPPYSENLEVNRRALDESSPPEGKGREGNGKETKGKEWNGEKQSSDASTSVGASAPEKPDDDQNSEKPSQKRDVQVAILLRGLGVKPMNAMHPNCQEWANNPLCTDALLQEAVAVARQYKPNEDIHPNYLRPIVEDTLQPKPQKVDSSWRRTPQGIEQMGNKLGMIAKRNENHDAYASRIQAEIQRRQREEGATA